MIGQSSSTASCYMAAAIVIDDEHGLRVKVRHLIQPNKSKLTLYKLLLSL